MAERIQLKEPGSTRTMFVAGVTPEMVERNEYYLFHNATAMGGAWEMLVPQSSVKAQLERLGIQSVDQMIGKSVRFGRSTKMSRANKPFWDIDWASGAENGSAGGDMGKPNAGTPSAAPSADVQRRVAEKLDPTRTDEKPKLSDIYLKATEFVIDKVLPKYVAAGIGVSDTAIVAAVATLFIAASKER